MWNRKSKQSQTKPPAEQTGAPPDHISIAALDETPPAEPSQDLVGPDVPIRETPQALSSADPAAPRLGPWRMSLLLAGSAFCGGIAVVLWNRRLLTKMREVEPVTRSQQGRLWEDDL